MCLGGWWIPLVAFMDIAEGVRGIGSTPLEGKLPLLGGGSLIRKAENAFKLAVGS